MATVAPEVPAFERDAAFEKLYREYVTDVYHYALALLRNPADAEDVTQTTFMNAYRAFRSGEEIRKPQNWLIKIAHNVARSRYSRMARRVKEVPLDDHVDQLAAADEEKPDVEGVLRALSLLPFNQRAALVMRELEGRSYAEISDTLGVSVSAVETLIFRARRSLRVRVTALKSILAVPLPTSLEQVFGGGGAIAGGVGAGFLVKAAVALVAGAVATGVSSDRGDRAEAAPKTQQAVATKASAPSTARTTVVRAKTTRHAARVERSGQLPRRVGRPALRHRGAYRPLAVAPTVTPAVASSAREPAPAPVQSSGSTAPAPAPAPPPVVTETVENVAQTVNQAVSAVTAAVPVQVPPLPVEAPNLPKLP